MKTKKLSVYQTKLKDPKWQKKRLEILNRDNWTCVLCKDTETTLHVHHDAYEYGKEPWEYENENLTTLCEHCHREVELYKNENKIDEIIVHKTEWSDGSLTIYLYVHSLGKILVKTYEPNQKGSTVFNYSIGDFYDITEFFQKAAYLHDREEREEIRRLYFNNNSESDGTLV